MILQCKAWSSLIVQAIDAVLAYWTEQDLESYCLHLVVHMFIVTGHCLI